MRPSLQQELTGAPAQTDTENVKELLRLLSVSETFTQYDALEQLQRIYSRLPEPVNAAILADPRSLGHLMHVLQTSPVEYVRNECLSFLLLLTADNADIQTIVTVQGFIETIFSILEDEDLTLGGKVARDLLRCLMNVVGNTTCQKYLRETDGAASLVSAISHAVAGKPGSESEEEDKPEVSAESRWACLSLLLDAALLLASPLEEAEAREAEANRLALIKAGALDLCQHLSNPQLAEAAQLMLVRLFESLEQCPQAADLLQSFERGHGNSSGPLLFDLVGVLLGPVTRLSLRNALGRVLCRCVARHASLQSFLCSSLSPQLADSPEVRPAGRLLVDVLEAACLSGGGGAASSEVSWFALGVLLAMMRGNTSVQSACATMPVSIPGDAGPAKTFQELLFGAFSATVRSCLAAHGDQEAEDSMSGPSQEVSTLLGFLKLLLYWLATCPTALGSFATSPVMIPLAVDLTCVGNRCGAYQAQIEGLACLLLGTCISEHTEVDCAALMSLIARRVGIEAYQEKVKSLLRSEALQRPPRGLAEFRWYNAHYRNFVREQQRVVQRRMVQLYVAEGVGGGGLSEDVAEHYKQLIRVQDTELREARHENEQLRSEVEAFMKRTLKASSAALADKADALEMENKALHVEVGELQQELDQRVGRLEQERQKLRVAVSELELQLQSMAVSYGQVEQNNAELRAALAVAKPAANGGLSAAKRAGSDQRAPAG